MEPVDLADRILSTPGIEGVTFSGGEPFCQAESVARCGGILKEQGLNTVTFTGYTYDHIRKKGRKSWDALLGVPICSSPVPIYRNCTAWTRCDPQ